MRGNPGPGNRGPGNSGPGNPAPTGLSFRAQREIRPRVTTRRHGASRRRPLRDCHFERSEKSVPRVTAGRRGASRRRPYGGRGTAGRGTRPLRPVISSAARNPSPVSQQGGVGRRDAGPTAGVVRRTGESGPYGGKRPEFVIARAGTARGNPYPPSPFLMFSNRNLKTPTFSIFNFQFSIPNSPAGGCMWRSMTAATAGCGVRRAVNDRRYGGVRSTAGGQ